MALVDELRAQYRYEGPDPVERLSVLMERFELTQERLAAELGVNRVTVQRWLSGTRRPGREERLRLGRLVDDLDALDEELRRESEGIEARPRRGGAGPSDEDLLAFAAAYRDAVAAQSPKPMAATAAALGISAATAQRWKHRAVERGAFDSLADADQ